MSSTTKKPNPKSITLWGLTGILALVFAAAGAAKLAGVAEVVLPFERMSIPMMAYVVGIIEIACAIGLFLPKVRFFSAVALSATMLGAAAYHLLLDPEKAVAPAIVLFVMCAALAWLRKPSKI